MSPDDVDALYNAGRDNRIWQVSPRTMESLTDMADYVDEALEAHRAGTALPFVITLTDTGEVVGSTRFGAMNRQNLRVEIGWTWLAVAHQRTGANTEAKLLLLDYAFDVLGCIRVEFKTDVLNARSRCAIERIGGKEEGILRSHVITSSGRRRDTVYYSILDEDWPDIRRRLQDRLLAG